MEVTTNNESNIVTSNIYWLINSLIKLQLLV